MSIFHYSRTYSLCSALDTVEPIVYVQFQLENNLLFMFSSSYIITSYLYSGLITEESAVLTASACLCTVLSTGEPLVHIQYQAYMQYNHHVQCQLQYILLFMFSPSYSRPSCLYSVLTTVETSYLYSVLTTLETSCICSVLFTAETS